ncbi:MAG: CAP domain-containing protein [Chloroflexota bacterium]
MHRFPAVFGILLCLALGGAVTPALAAGTSDLVSPQIVALVNQDRVGAGLSALTVDARLTTIADARAQYMLLHGFFSHCSGGEGDTSCPLSGYDFVAREQSAGIGVQVAGTTVAENLALNNAAAATAAAQTNTAWLNSPEHKANIMDSRLTYTGVAAICCFAGSVGGTTISAADNVTVYVQEFSGGPGAVPPLTGAAPAGTCQYILGFATLHGLDSADTSGCVTNQAFAANGDAQQTTANGLMAWRKLDNWTAFTNGYWTWINGPAGLAKRLNTERFAWEANPDGLPLAS